MCTECNDCIMCTECNEISQMSALQTTVIASLCVRNNTEYGADLVLGRAAGTLTFKVTSF